MYLLDTLFTVCIVHQLVVVYWRGVWEIIDIQVKPDDPQMSAITCLVIAYILHTLLCLIQTSANVLYQSQCSKVKRWALESFIFFIANLVSVTHWRGFWVLLDYHFIPDNPGLSAGITHSVGMVVLWLMMCAHSVTTSGCSIDGESPNEEGCLIPNYYIRLFVSQSTAVVNEAINMAATNSQANTNTDKLQSKF